MSARFLQLHTLTSYPASLLNRDDAGFAKRIRFGGALRTRISSQCLKRHWRTADGPYAITDAAAGLPQTLRSRQTFELRMVRPLVAEGFAEATVAAVVQELMNRALGKSEKAAAKAKGKAAKEEREPLKTEQVVVLGEPEVKYLVGLAREACSGAADAKAAMAALDRRFKGKEGNESLANLMAVPACGLDAALFGRMITGDLFARSDAAIHVAHAFTVHAEATEPDYFTVVDELVRGEGELGAGHVNVAELTTGLFYNYVVVDLAQLVGNLEGDKAADQERARAVIRRLVGLMATQSPGAKRGSTAPYAYAHLVFAERTNRQPRTLANAFLNPVEARGDLAAQAVKALADHTRALDGMYGAFGERAFAHLGGGAALEGLGAQGPFTLDALADWAAEGWEQG